MAETYYVKPDNSPVNNVTLNSYDAMYINNGGTANGTIINGLASAVVNDGGTANNTTVHGSGTLTALGGQAVGVTVASAGRLETNKGTTVTGITAAKGAILALSIAPDTVAAGTSDGVAFQIQNGIATGFELEIGVLTVSSGGTAVNTILNSAGILNVFNGCKATGAAVNANGELKVFSGGTAAGATVNMGGKLIVESGGLSEDAVVSLGGSLEVNSSGGLATGTIVSGGLTLSKGGKAIGTTVAAGGVVNVGTKGVAEGVDVNGFLNVLDGGLASNATLNEGAVVYIQSNGSASDFAVDYGAFLEVLSGGKLKGATVSEGGSATIHADVMASNVVVDGGKVTVKSDGWAAQTGVSGNTIVKNGGMLLIEDGGHVESAYVSAGGRVDVLNGGYFGTGKIANGEVYAFQGANVSRMNLEEKGILCVESGASAQHINVSAGGVLTGVLREASEIRFYGGTVDLDISTAAADSEYLIDYQSFSNFITTDIYTYLCTLTVDGAQADGTYNLIEDATGFDTTITVVNTSGATLGTLTVGGAPATIGDKKYTLSLDASGLSVTIGDGGGATPDITGDLDTSFELTAGMVGSSVNILDEGILNVFNDGFTSQTTVNSGGDLSVSAGGSADVVTVNFGGDFFVRDGGKATLVKENGGYASVNDGATATFVPNAFAGYSYLNPEDWCTIHSGTTGTDLTAGNGGEIRVSSGGTAAVVNVAAEGELKIYTGGKATDMTVASGGFFYVYDGGSATGIVAADGARLHLVASPDAYAQGTYAGSAFEIAENVTGFTVHSGCTLDVYAGGTAVDTTVAGNAYFYVQNGGKLTGKVTIETGANVDIDDGAIVDFDLTQTTTADPALVNDLSFFNGTAVKYTLTVDGTQASGTYKLAGNVASFNKIISVRNTSGADYGYLTFGGTLSTSFADFTLNLTGATLAVDVVAKGGADTKPPTITITPSTTELAKSVTMTAKFTDNVAVANKQYRIGDGAWLNYEAPFTVTENCLIGFRATDTSGNTTVESYEVQNIQPDEKNVPDNGWNDYLYDKKKGWNKDENISQFAPNTITGNGEIALDLPGTIALEGMHNMFGNDGINIDSGDVGSISVPIAAKMSFLIQSTADGTFYIYEDGFDKKDNRAQITVGKVAVKKGKIATLSGICLKTDGLYYAAMTAKNVKKPGPAGTYNVTVVDSTIFVDADDGWNNAPTNKAVVDNPFKIERGVGTVKLDNTAMIDGGGVFNNFVGFSDPVDYAKLELASTAYLSFNLETNGSTKFTLWKRDTGTGKFKKVGGVTTLKSKKGELVMKSTKAQLLEVGDKYDYFVSMESTDQAKGGSAYYNVNVNTVATRFFDSNDGGENNWLFDKKNKTYNDDANLRSNTLSAFGDKVPLYLDNTVSGDTAFNNFVGFKDSADYAKIVLTKNGSLSFKITALANVTFEIWQKGTDKKGKNVLNSLQKKTSVKVKDYAVGASVTTDALTLEAGEYYVSVTAKSTKANEKGSAFYNVTATFSSSESLTDALAMPETASVASALEMPMAAAAYADSASNKLFGESANGLLASL